MKNDESASEVIATAAGILRGPPSEFMNVMRLLACGAILDEALAEWMENHPDDPRAEAAARGVCEAAGMLLDAELRLVAGSEDGTQG